MIKFADKTKYQICPCVFLSFLFLLCVPPPVLAADYAIYITPSLSVDQEYSDNVFSSSKDAQDDFITNISAVIEIEASGKTSRGTLKYTPGYSVYNEFSDANTLRHQASLAASADISKHTFVEFRNEFQRSEDPLSDVDIAVLRTEDPTLPVDTTIRRGRNVFYSNYANIKLSHRFGRDDSVSLSYGNRLLKNQDASIEDSTAHNIAANLTYWFSTQWGWETFLGYDKEMLDRSDDQDQWSASFGLLRRFGKHFTGHLRYSYTLMDYESVSENDQTHNPSIGIQYSLEKDISLSVDMGYYINDFGLRESQSGVSLNAGLVKKYQRGTLNLSGQGGQDYANGGAENLGFEEYYEFAASGSYQITQSVDGNLSGSFRNSSYKDTLLGREDNSYRAGLGIRWQAVKWMSLGTTYTFRQVDSSDPANDYSENRIAFDVKLSPSESYRMK